MRLCRGQIVSNTDLAGQGRILVYAKEVSDAAFFVTYVSPYGAHSEGGMIAIPEEGHEILITQPENSSMWYYLGTIYVQPEGKAEKGKEVLYPINSRKELFPDQDIYKARGKPQKIVLKSPAGNSLTLSDSYNPKYFNQKAELKSSTGKKLALIDSPNVDCIILRNEHRDGVKITSSPSVVSAARSVEIESKGPQKYICRESQMELLVKDGKELNIKNESTGINRNEADPTKYGNINLRSRYRDINLVANSQDGRIFLDALGTNGSIQIDSNGKIILWAEGDLELRAGGNIKLKAGANIQAEADGAIELKAGSVGTLSADGRINIKAGGVAAMDGSQVHLNSKIAQSANGVDINRLVNYYGE